MSSVTSPNVYSVSFKWPSIAAMATYRCRLVKYCKAMITLLLLVYAKFKHRSPRAELSLKDTQQEKNIIQILKREVFTKKLSKKIMYNNY